tara:strand:+ start:318 stop:611 length:294 start_codon:yes stop_codon:yes gene_type:complete
VRVYICDSTGCGKGLITEFQEWGCCPKCGGRRWKKLRKSTYWRMLKIWWISGRELWVPPQGSRIERFLKKRMVDEAEHGITEAEVRENVPDQFTGRL